MHPQQLREGRASWGGSIGSGADLLLSVSGLRARGEDRFFDFGDAGVAGVATRLDGERDKEFLARVSGADWSFDLVAGDRRKDDPTGVYLADPLASGGHQRDRMLLSQLQMNRRVDDDRLELSGRVFMGRERYDAPATFGGNRTAQIVASDWYGVELRALSTAWAGHKLMLGVEAQRNARQDQTFDDFVATPGIIDVTIPRDGWRVGVYAQDEWTISAALVATLGLRVDRNNATGTATSPRVGLIWKASPATTLKALYGRAHRAPNVYERDYEDGMILVANPMLERESIETAELVAEHRLRPNFALRASAYRWTMRGLITQGVEPVSGLTRYDNSVSDTGARGLEIAADSTWSGVRIRASLSSQHVDGSMANSPRWLGRLNTSGPLPWADLVAGFELRHDAARRTLDGSSTAAATLANLTLGRAFGNGFEASLGIANLLDKRYEQPGSRNNWQNTFEQDGRSIRLQLGWRP